MCSLLNCWYFSSSHPVGKMVTNCPGGGVSGLQGGGGGSGGCGRRVNKQKKEGQSGDSLKGFFCRKIFTSIYQKNLSQNYFYVVKSFNVQKQLAHNLENTRLRHALSPASQHLSEK